MVVDVVTLTVCIPSLPCLKLSRAGLDSVLGEAHAITEVQVLRWQERLLRAPARRSIDVPGCDGDIKANGARLQGNGPSRLSLPPPWYAVNIVDHRYVCHVWHVWDVRYVWYARYVRYVLYLLYGKYDMWYDWYVWYIWCLWYVWYVWYAWYACPDTSDSYDWMARGF